MGSKLKQEQEDTGDGTTTTTTSPPTELLHRYTEANQAHVFDYWSTLTSVQQQQLVDQLHSIDVEKLEGYFRSATGTGAGTHGDSGIKENEEKEEIQPFSGKVYKVGKDSSGDKDLYEIGMKAIRANKTAALLLAGGQGTRLGFNGPKGMYDIGLPSKSTLFALIAKRILKLTQLANKKDSDGSDDDTTTTRCSIPLYIMTSPMNHHTTKTYFETHNYFSLPSNDVIFFSQGVLPCLSPSGKILMENPYTINMAPDGNGGIYPAMEKNGILKDLKEKGVEHVHAFAIDNALVKPCDPQFLGYCISEQADCGNKVLWKVDAHEKVGVIAEKVAGGDGDVSKGKGKPCVVEYSELSQEMAERTVSSSSSDDDKLAFGAANICNHYYSLPFLQEKVIPNYTNGNMYHVAHKKIPVWDASQQKTIIPSSNNGIKLESFIFDVFPLSTSMAILEVERKHEFAPVKNAPGKDSTDSPDTARKMISAMAKEWIESAGGTLKVKEVSATGDKDGYGEDEGSSSSSCCCEVDPLTSYAGEGMEKYRGQELECPFAL